MPIRMQTVDKFKLALGIMWSLYTVFGIFLLFPPMDRRLRKWETKIKQIKGMPAAPSRLQRVVFLLLTSLMTGVVLTDAFHRNFAELTGISSGAVCLLMMVLPALYFLLGLLKQRPRNGQLPDA